MVDNERKDCFWRGIMAGDSIRVTKVVSRSSNSTTVETLHGRFDGFLTMGRTKAYFIVLIVDNEKRTLVKLIDVTTILEINLKFDEESNPASFDYHQAILFEEKE